MGLIKALKTSANTVLGDQWKDYYICDSMPSDILIKKANHHVSNGSSNTNGAENIITQDSVIIVNEGQCMLLVDQGKVVEVCAEAGEFIYDGSTEPSVFAGGLGDGILDSFKKLGSRTTFGGETGHDQRIYYVNTKELPANKFGTANPIPFRVVDKNIGLDVDTSIKCYGTYTLKVVDPVLLYTNLSGNVSSDYTIGNISTQLLTEFLSALQPALAKVSALGVRYSELPAHTTELTNALDEELSNTWGANYGLDIITAAIASATLSEEDEQMIKDLQKTAVLKDTNMAAATLTAAQAEAMKSAAANESTGPMMAFAGMNMAQQAGGINATQLYEMNKQQAASTPTPSAPAPSAPEASAPTSSEGPKFCPECGTGVAGMKFCPNCGKKLI